MSAAGSVDASRFRPARAWGLWAISMMAYLGIALIGSTQTARAADTAKPVFEPVKCPKGVGASRCGYVIVPEHRQRPGRTIKLFTLQTHRAGRAGRAPIFFLTGGPGEKASRLPWLASLFPDRDFVTFDQRGVGRSRPNLECPDYNRLALDPFKSLSITSEFTAELTQGLIRCGERFRRQGIDLEGYNASESAADVEAIRQALGYGKINLMGVSYGTRLAQEVMRRYSDSLRAVILDSVVPAAIDRAVETPQSAEAALRRVFAACDADKVCLNGHRDLARSYQKVFDQLSAHPLRIKSHGKELSFNVNGFQAIMLLYLYSPSTIAELPHLLFDLEAGKSRQIRSLISWKEPRNYEDAVTWGAFFATECQGEIAYSDQGALEQVYAKYPNWRKSLGDAPGISSPRIREVCSAWGLTRPSGEENQPVRSNVPTLLLGGEFDPVTPPRFLALAAESLSHAYTFELKGQAHAVSLNNPCAMSLVQDFLTKPEQKPHKRCVSELSPRFYPG